MIFTHFVSSIVDYWSPHLAKNRPMITLQEAQNIHENEKRVVRLCQSLRCFMGETVITLLVFSANFKNTFDNCSVPVIEAVLVLAY